MANSTSGLTVLDTATRQGVGEFNEDLAGNNDTCAWMFDGATDTIGTFRPDPRTTGAYWISRTCDEWLRRHDLTQRPAETITELAAHVKASLRDAGMPREALPPACSAGIVRRSADEVAAAIVGDIFVYHDGRDDLLDYPAFGANERRAVRAQTSPQQAAEGIAERRRRYLAGSDGAWVLGDNPYVAAGARTIAWPAVRGDIVLLATDGFARAVTDYKIAASWHELVELVRERSASSVIDMIREHESTADTQAALFKKSDDVCVSLVQIT
ncbi:protein phosphatase 2C domain-containing protein [Promicromonospora sp. MS192]|uniref:protein phosphatase 2C domain-containing protein n=1 Tax=Promicromonospora sp. MS192 TaxID=3412684 RepID=UPI003C2EA4D7